MSSASATTSGPRVVNRPLVSLPSSASGSASQYPSAGSARQVPVIATSTAPVRVEPVDERQRVAGLDAERGGGALGQRGLDRRLARRRPAAVDELGVVLDALERGELREVRDRRRIARPRPRRPTSAGPPRPRRRWPRGRAAARARPPPRRPSRRSGRILVRTTIARSAAGADSSSRCRPASVTASVYSVPAASSDRALASRAHEASTTGRSARLRRSTVDQRPSDVGS